jgi:hypothetical protein
VLRDFENEPLAIIVGFQSIQNLGQVAIELHVDDGAGNLSHAPDFVAA